MNIHLFTDSTADIPDNYVEEFNINVVPLNVLFDEESFLDGVELKSKDFFNKLKSSDVLPRTSQPSPGDFVKAYKDKAKEGDVILSLHLSSELSGTYQSAVMAADIVKEDGIKVEVIDTRLASMGLGYAVIEIARAIKNGEDQEKVLSIVKELIKDPITIFIVDTLEYLQKNGRIGKASAMLGTVLNFKPVLSLVNGSILPLTKARGRKKAQDKLIEICKEQKGTKGKACIIVHAEAENIALELKDKLEKNGFEFEELIITNIGAVIGTHTGPGLTGVIIFSGLDKN